MYKKTYLIISSLRAPIDFENLLEYLPNIQEEYTEFNNCADSSFSVKILDNIHVIRGTDLTETKCEEIRLLFEHTEKDKTLEAKYAHTFQELVHQVCKKMCKNTSTELKPAIFIHWGEGTPELYKKFSKILQSTLKQYCTFVEPVVIPFSGIDPLHTFLTSENITKIELIRELERLEGTSVLYRFFSRFFILCSTGNVKKISEGASNSYFKDLWDEWNYVLDVIETLSTEYKETIKQNFIYDRQEKAFVVYNVTALRKVINEIIMNLKAPINI